MISPVAIWPGGGSINRMIDKALTDFPDPDSPTTPKRSLSWMVKEMPSTARTIPSSVEKYVRRLRTWRRGAATSFSLLAFDALGRIESVAKTVTEEVDREHR